VKTKDDTSIIIIPERKIEVIRTPEEFAKAVMESGSEFGKIHKPHHLDPFHPFRKR